MARGSYEVLLGQVWDTLHLELNVPWHSRQGPEAFVVVDAGRPMIADCELEIEFLYLGADESSGKEEELLIDQWVGRPRPLLSVFPISYQMNINQNPRFLARD